MQQQLNNLKALEENRKTLRKNLTSAEAFLWTYLQKSQLKGRKFRRQHSFGRFIMDFYCPSEKLAVELDGAGHFTEEGMKYDEERTKYLEEHGIQVLRFENRLVFENLGGVLSEIERCFLK